MWAQKFTLKSDVQACNQNTPSLLSLFLGHCSEINFINEIVVIETSDFFDYFGKYSYPLELSQRRINL